MIAESEHVRSLFWNFEAASLICQRYLGHCKFQAAGSFIGEYLFAPGISTRPLVR